jgi:hypothetical protein
MAKAVFDEMMAIRGLEGSTQVPGEYVTAFEEIPVSKDSGKNLYYSNMPSTTMSLPYDMGVYQISNAEGQDFPFAPMPNATYGIMAGLAVSYLGGRIGYWLENTRVYYTNMDAKNAPKVVLMKLLITGTSNDIDEPINIADNIQMDIIQRVMSVLGQTSQIPNDDVNDMSNKK